MPLHERDAALMNLEVLETTVVNVLSTRDEPPSSTAKSTTTRAASGFVGGFDQQRLLTSQRVPHDVASTHVPMISIHPCRCYLSVHTRTMSEVANRGGRGGSVHGTLEGIPGPFTDADDR
jgi:hypothetical protein